MKKALLAGLFCLISGILFSQSPGDYRTRRDGNWFANDRWEVFNNGAWRILTTAAAGPFQNVIPSNVSGQITIRNNIGISSNLNVNQLVVNSGFKLTVATGVVVTFVDDFSQAPLSILAGATFTNFGTVDLQSQLSSTPCIVNGLFQSSATVLTGNSSLLVFNSGSIYQHLNGSGGSVPLGTWNAGSTCMISGMNFSNALAPGNLGQAFANFTWNTPSMGNGVFSLGGGLQNVTGNLRVVTTGNPARYLRFGNGGAGYSLTVGGDFIMQNGLVILAQSQTSTSTVTINGNLVISGGTLNLGASNSSLTDVRLNGNFVKTGGTIAHVSSPGAGTIRFDGGIQTYSNNAAITSAVSFSVENGSTLDLGTTFLTGAGNFTLFAGGTVNIGSTDAGGAIQLGSTGGNIRLTGTRTYQTGSLINYNGAAAQFMGNGHPANPNTNINNVNDVTMVASASVNGLLNMVAGFLLIEANTLSLGGTYATPGGTTIAASTASSITINGTGDFSDLLIAFSQFPNNPINNLTINRAGGTVFLGTDLIVGGTFTQTNGNFDLGQFNPFTLTLRGPFVQTIGSLRVYDVSSLVIEGAGALPADVNIIGPSIGTLTMNRPSSTFVSTSALLITNLNLFNGTVNNSTFNITMQANGIVTRQSGAVLSQVLGVDPNSYDLIYDVATDITTGPELPFILPVTTRLGNLTKMGTATVNLTHDIVINGTFTILEGTFNVGVGNDVTINRNLTVDGTFATQQGLVTFAGNSDQTISGLSPIAFYDAVVNQTVGSNIDIATNVDINNSLTVTSASTVNAGNQLLRLVSNATSTAYVGPMNASAAIEGTVIAERHLPNANGTRQYRYITPVVTGTSVADWKDEMLITGTFSDPVVGPGIISNSPSMYIYQETFTSGGTSLEARFRPYPTSGLSSAAPITNGRGYAVFGRTTGATAFDSRGRLGQGPRPIGVTNSGGVNGGWNLIGNPYPSPIDWDLVAPSLPPAVANAIYFTDNNNNGGGGGNVSYVNGVGVPASFTGIVAPGQAFFLRTTSGATITFQESHKFAGQGQFLREEPISNLLRIALNGSGKRDETALRLHSEATDSFDPKFDAVKFPEPGFSIAMPIDNAEKLSINSISSLSCGKTIPLTLETSKGNFNLEFSGLESFENGMVVQLRDKVLNKVIEITTASQYAFSSDGISVKDRFEIVIDMPAIETSLQVAGESICTESKQANVTISNTQSHVVYTVQWNGQRMSPSIPGNGGSIQVPVNVESLPQGDQEVTVLAEVGSCASTPLVNKGVLKLIAAGLVDNVQHGVICEPGPIVLKAASNNGVSFKWYEGESDVNPITGANSAEFTTPALEKSKTYFVAAVNTLGCEGARMPVTAEVLHTEPVLLTQDGSILTSSYTQGNTWYLNGMKIEGETGNTLEVVVSGVYSVEITNKGCKTTAFRDMNVTGFEENLSGGFGVIVYPNPTEGKVTVEVKNRNQGVPMVNLISPVGTELNTLKLKEVDDKYVGEIDLVVYPAGIYMIQVRDGQKFYIRKISKVK